MTTWNTLDLNTFARTDELQIASRRTDGTLRPYVTIWVGSSAGEVYVRSAHGVDNGWFRRARAAGTGRVRAGGLERDVTFVDVVDPAVHTALDAALHAKYDRYGPGPVGAITGPGSHPATLRVQPV